MTTNTAVSAPSAKRSLFVRLFYPGPTQNRVVEGPARKGGRNVPAAVGVAVLLIGLVALSLIFNKVYFALLVAVAICVALWELAGAFARRAVGLPLSVTCLSWLALRLCCWPSIRVWARLWR